MPGDIPQARTQGEKATTGHRPTQGRTEKAIGSTKDSNGPQTTGQEYPNTGPQATRRRIESPDDRLIKMKRTQQELNFEPPARTRRALHSPHVKPSEQKEELLRFTEQKEDKLIHYRQGKTKYCALYALAMLEGLDPEHVIKTAKKTVSGTRTRYTGQFWQIRNTYCNLGYYFPFDRIPDQDIQRIRDVDPGQFSGKGHVRIQKRRTSNKGHQLCYKNGIIYDSSTIGPQPARLYLTNLIKRKYCYIILKPQ